MFRFFFFRFLFSMPIAPSSSSTILTSVCYLSPASYRVRRRPRCWRSAPLLLMRALSRFLFPFPSSASPLGYLLHKCLYLSYYLPQQRYSASYFVCSLSSSSKAIEPRISGTSSPRRLYRTLEIVCIGQTGVWATTRNGAPAERNANLTTASYWQKPNRNLHVNKGRLVDLNSLAVLV